MKSKTALKDSLTARARCILGPSLQQQQQQQQQKEQVKHRFRFSLPVADLFAMPNSSTIVMGDKNKGLPDKCVCS
jgi:hypothetical protein